MKERQIFFTGPEVQAILEGRKTVIRRVIKNMEKWDTSDLLYRYAKFGENLADVTFFHYDKTPVVPPWQPGDRLWVRETWQAQEPGEACRIVTEITDVRVERVQGVWSWVISLEQLEGAQ